MAYVVCKNPSVQIDLMVMEQYWPKLASIIEQTGCKYTKEDKTKVSNGNKYIVLRDIQAKKGRELGEALALFFGLEWCFLKNDESGNSLVDKFYILVRPRKKGKKFYVQENRKETCSGSEGGDSGESGNCEAGSNSGTGGSGDVPANAGTDSVCECPVVVESNEEDLLDNNQ